MHIGTSDKVQGSDSRHNLGLPNPGLATVRMVLRLVAEFRLHDTSAEGDYIQVPWWVNHAPQCPDLSYLAMAPAS